MPARQFHSTSATEEQWLWSGGGWIHLQQLANHKGGRPTKVEALAHESVRLHHTAGRSKRQCHRQLCCCFCQYP